MTYLLLGEDGQEKDTRISELKNKYLASPDARSFDYDVYYGNDLDPQTLKQALLALPAIAARRFVLIHAVHKLHAHHLKLLEDFIAPEQKHIVLVLESNEWTGTTDFVRKLKKAVKVIEFKQPEQKNVFAMTRLMTMRRTSEALQVLRELLAEGTHPLQILGGMIWYWGRQRERLDQQRFEKGLRILQQADVNIKRSRLDSHYAVELAVVKLCAIL
jgi:DNA polymerase III delta subunit